MPGQEPMNFMVQSENYVQKATGEAANNNVGQLDLFNELDLLNTNQAPAAAIQQKSQSMAGLDNTTSSPLPLSGFDFMRTDEPVAQQQNSSSTS